MNTDSCDMRLVADDDLVMDGQPGDFFIGDVDVGEGRMQKMMWMKLPGNGYCVLYIGVGAKPDRSPSWQWDGNMSRPTLSPSIWHAPRTGAAYEWHGFVRNGRMESC